MDHGTILDVHPRPDGDGCDIPTDDAIEPARCVLPDVDFPDHGGIRRKPAGRMDGRGKVTAWEDDGLIRVHGISAFSHQRGRSKMRN